MKWNWTTLVGFVMHDLTGKYYNRLKLLVSPNTLAYIEVEFG
jgi:hypothetical protein